MKRFCILILTVIAAFVVRELEAADTESAAESIKARTADKWLVILDAERDFHSAKRQAERVSPLSRVQFSMNGSTFDNRQGLIDADAGEYVLRRYNENRDYSHGYISIEKSDVYPGLRKGYYIVVGAICDSSQDAEAERRHFARFARSAYVAKTQIYMGCIH